MRLLVISNLYPPDVQGGYEILCAQVVERLERRGHEVWVLTSTAASREAARAGGRVLRRLGLTAPFPDRVPRSLSRFLALHRRNAAITATVIHDVKPDHIFVWSQLRLTLGASEAAEASGIPVSYTFNDDHPAGFLARPLTTDVPGWPGAIADRLLRRTRLNALQLARTTCISETLRLDLLARGVPVERTRVIHQGIPLERFAPLLERPRGATLRVLYVGQLHAYKGVHTLLEAAPLLFAAGAPPFEISIAGEGGPEYTKRLRDLALAAGVTVRFLGRVPHGEIPSLYRTHDLFVFPSIWREPFGLTHLEAMASGTPVVSTTEGGPGEFLDDGVNALTFEASNPHSLAHALLRLARDQGLAGTLARNARAMVETRFSLDRYVSDLEAFLQERAA